jgi:hypothetical protein
MADITPETPNQNSSDITSQYSQIVGECWDQSGQQIASALQWNDSMLTKGSVATLAIPAVGQGLRNLDAGLKANLYGFSQSKGILTILRPLITRALPAAALLYGFSRASLSSGCMEAYELEKGLPPFEQ